MHRVMQRRQFGINRATGGGSVANFGRDLAAGKHNGFGLRYDRSND
jgi:hypothetical protein